MEAIARGLTTPDGAEPALYASTTSPPSMRAKASAIWLRFELWTQTNRTRLGLLAAGAPAGGLVVDAIGMIHQTPATATAAAQIRKTRLMVRPAASQFFRLSRFPSEASWTGVPQS